MADLIYDDGYRANVGIIISNQNNNLFFAKRRYQSGWQFPQGGINVGETPIQAMYRELNEETGLYKKNTKFIKESDHWYQYQIPHKSIRKAKDGIKVIGQRQKWYLLQFTDEEEAIDLNHHNEQEFDSWKWATPDIVIKQVIGFKKEVYRKVLEEFKPFIEK
ncbi:MAG: RNA pyrophosphohydrolase [Gammaproteobacteria bacterium]|nr:RNA pyrophosphohydrolase [Gammaproteobacteria bacterium]